MKKVYLLLLLLIFSIESNGQLSISNAQPEDKKQLEELLSKAIRNSDSGICCIIIGGICFTFGEVYLHRANHPDEPGFMA